eukprot:Blabericola_migrator_1__9894@NODE_5457_length_762_cov_137_828777_g3522_i0_p2_GENE_NODE_5457_length_762_cov_137_828777_g3522_i0NODE_5457_length_762_cov_137_828777_g3522_i0_p2_ORF_typecomplete_len133_score6_62FIST_C/PF10442_9/0_4_NODE_5457_length_762_cov_137_828777_g3522_i0182580
MYFGFFTCIHKHIRQLACRTLIDAQLRTDFDCRHIQKMDFAHHEMGYFCFVGLTLCAFTLGAGMTCPNASDLIETLGSVCKNLRKASCFCCSFSCTTVTSVINKPRRAQCSKQAWSFRRNASAVKRATPPLK